jgi:hypothetical protein
VESKQQTLSLLVAICWRELAPEEKKVWNDLAKKMKQEHSLRYPNYRYRPSPRGVIKRRRQSSTREQQLEKCSELIFKYIPDKSGDKSKTRVTSKSKSDAKSPRSQRNTRHGDSDTHPPSSSSQDPVFIEPLVRAPSSSSDHSTYSPWDMQVEQSQIPPTHDEDVHSSFYNIPPQHVECPTESHPLHMVPEWFPKSVEGHAHLETFGLQRPTFDPERASASPGDLGFSMIDFSGLFGVDWNLHEASGLWSPKC